MRTLPVETGVTEVVWDGKDWKGRETAAGVYWVRFDSNAGASLVRIR
jgi:hypothetical protein